MNSDFEKRLQEQPIRQIPAEWRAEILQNVKSSSAAQPSTPNPQPGLASWFRELLWPCPQAWAGLAAVWLVILGVNLSTEKPARMMARETKASPANVLMTWREQNELLSQLIESPVKEVAERPKVFIPRPRSEGRVEFVTV